MKQIYSYYNAPKTKGEINTAPSRTIPDQSMTVREIINRSNKGLPITGVKVPMYNETDDGIMPDLSRMDISEIYALKQSIQNHEKELRKKLQEESDKRQQEETEAYYRKKFGTKPEVKTEVITETEEVK